MQPSTDKCLSRDDVAKIYNIDHDTAGAIMRECPGCIDISLGKKRKFLRVSQDDLTQWERQRSRVTHAGGLSVMKGGKG